MQIAIRTIITTILCRINAAQRLSEKDSTINSKNKEAMQFEKRYKYSSISLK